MTIDYRGFMGLCRLLRTGLLLAAIGVAAVGVWGCNMIKGAAYFLQPTSEKINPEFKGLENKQVLIYIWAPPEITWDYPKLRLDLSAYLTDYLRKQVPKARMMEVLTVERYLEQQNALEQDPVELGKHFKADIVLHLSVYEFSLRDPDMAHFYRGRLGASVQVYDMTKGEEPERTALQDAKVIVPEDAPVGVENMTAAQIRQATYDAFTVEVGKKFHQWEKPIE